MDPTTTSQRTTSTLAAGASPESKGLERSSSVETQDLAMDADLEKQLQGDLDGVVGARQAGADGTASPTAKEPNAMPATLSADDAESESLAGGPDTPSTNSFSPAADPRNWTMRKKIASRFLSAPSAEVQFLMVTRTFDL